MNVSVTTFNCEIGSGFIIKIINFLNNIIMNNLTANLIAKTIIENGNINVVIALLNNICYGDTNHKREDRICYMVENEDVKGLTTKAKEKIVEVLTKNYKLVDIKHLTAFVDNIDNTVYAKADVKLSRWFANEEDAKIAEWRGISNEDDTHHVHKDVIYKDYSMSVSFDEIFED